MFYILLVSTIFVSFFSANCYSAQSVSSSESAASAPAPASASAPASAPASSKKVKLKNVKLVVEDPSRDYVQEKLVPVSPVPVKQKPASVPVLNMSSGLVKIPAQPVLEKVGEKEVKSSGGTSALAQADSVDVGEGKVSVEAVATENKPLLVPVANRGADVGGDVRVDAFGGAYSPFSPPPPGSLPSTLVSQEPLVSPGGLPSLSEGANASSFSVAPPVSEGVEDPLPPLASVQPYLNQPFPRVERATLASSGTSPQLPSLSSRESSQNAFFTESESQALLDIAGKSGQQEAPVNTIVAETW